MDLCGMYNNWCNNNNNYTTPARCMYVNIPSCFAAHLEVKFTVNYKKNYFR